MLDFGPDQLEVLEGLVMATPAWESPQIPEVLFQEQPEPIEAGGNGLAAIGTDPAEIMTEGAFLELWNSMHDMAGGMIQMRIGAPVPLGDQARGEGGVVAGKAAYALLRGSPALSKLFLSTQSTFLGQLFAIGMHSFGCLQIIKAAASFQPPQPQPQGGDNDHV